MIRMENYTDTIYELKVDFLKVWSMLESSTGLIKHPYS